MKEKNFQVKFNKWLRYVYKKTGAFELKITKGISLPFSFVVPHQEAALYAAKHSILVHKIGDDSQGIKPFDIFSLAGTPAYVVILFTRTRTFYGIDIDHWIEEKKTAKRRSLTEKQAHLISTFRG